MTPRELEALSPVDQVRRCARWLESFNVDAVEGFSATELLRMWRAAMLSDWDFTPDRWTSVQRREAAQGFVPDWVETPRRTVPRLANVAATKALHAIMERERAARGCLR